MSNGWIAARARKWPSNSTTTSAIRRKTRTSLRGKTFFSYYIDKGAIPYGDHRPARSTVQVAALPAGALVEIDLVARIS